MTFGIRVNRDSAAAVRTKSYRFNPLDGSYKRIPTPTLKNTPEMATGHMQVWSDLLRELDAQVRERDRERWEQMTEEERQAEAVSEFVNWSLNRP